MKRAIRQCTAAFVAAALLLAQALPVWAQPGAVGDIPAKSGILVEQNTGRVLYELNADEKMHPASITKVMTLLLVMEALDGGKISLEDKVTCSPNANSMGGSQIWLEVGEEMTVHELLKATAISSANDAACALGEHLAGSEDAFVDLMNRRAQELGMTNTHFENTNGLDADGHLSTARDISIMSRELLKHEKIKEYTTVWMDSLRDGKTQLVNTNRLIRFYKGATGLKTGTTDGAGSCLSASATRGNLSLVAVTMGSSTSDERFNAARTLLDYGFANYEAVQPPFIQEQLTPVKVLGGVERQVEVQFVPPMPVVVEKGGGSAITQEIQLAEDVHAPVEQGEVLGSVTVLVEGTPVSRYDLTAASGVERMTFLKGLETLWEAASRMNS